MSEVKGIARSPECQVGAKVVNVLRAMTDGVLSDEGFAEGDESIPSVVKFVITKPGREYSLNVYSLANGYTGFNTGCGQDSDDNSRRWTVYIDRGTNFAYAYDNKGTVYEHGRCQQPWFGQGRQNINTGRIDDLLFDFYGHNPSGTVSFEFLHHVDDPSCPPNHPSEPRMLFPGHDMTRPHTATSHPNPFGIVLKTLQ